MRELGKQYDDQSLVVRDLDATTNENQPKQKQLGFMSHGLVIVDHEKEVVFKQADHAVKADQVVAFVKDYLGKH